MAASGKRWLLLMLLIGLPLATWAAPKTGDAVSGDSSNGSALCSSCHQLGEDSPVHAMLNSVHGKPSPDSPMGQKGCAQCHGPSQQHAQSPTRNKPEVSFGPTWSDSVAQQNQVCQACHESNATRHWSSGLHARENLSCVTCHNLHTEATAMTAAQQTATCTQCHRPQRDGIHHLGQAKAQHKSKGAVQEVACSSCHNPHDNPKPVVTLLANRSEGCRSCHDLKAMQSSANVSEKAKTYHKAMASLDRTCIDCHRSVAHVALDQIEPPQVDAPDLITLFAPGTANFDWIRTDHPGAQPFRQGRNCAQCHAGEQAAMGKTLAPNRTQSSIGARLTLALVKNQLQVTVRWRGTPQDNSVALMLDDGSDEQFQRAGCWAACHNDLPGQDKNRGKAITKYLGASLKQQRSVGRYAVYHDDATLEAMLEQGHYVELWRARLQNGKLAQTQTYHVLSARAADAQAIVQASADYQDGQWTVVFRKPLNGPGKAIRPGQEYTFGIAIHGAGEEKSGHWVSLPMTFGLQMDDVDFPVQGR
ncbi:cytochrome c3 family protein [Ketobacter sp.]|uniref:cytochrome c3 family protein n=1 Tax=Ketobacter sp. TaxID=2083498 RepID=UPI0025B8739E|nr:cytochrome c3 family protein [Ketobacter sp.]